MPSEMFSEEKGLKRLKSKGRLNARGRRNKGIRRPYQSWGLLLQAFRTVMQLNQTEMADFLGISRASLSYYESGIFNLDDNVAKRMAELILTALVSKPEYLDREGK